MKMVVGIIRWIISLPFLLASLALVTAAGTLVVLGTALGTSDAPKQWIAQSGLYENAVDLGYAALTEKIETDARKEGTDVSIDDFLKGFATEDDIRRELHVIFPQEWIRLQAETVIDSVYAFLLGKSETLNIRIDIMERAAQAKKSIGNIFKQKIDSLPRCAAGSSVSIEALDIFSPNACRPAHYDTEALYAEIDKAVEHLAPFERVGTGSFELKDIKAENTGPLSRIMAIAPRALLLLGLLSLLVLSLLFLIVPGIRAGFVALGVIVTLAGIAFLVAGSGAVFDFDKIYDTYVTARLPEQTAIAAPYLHSMAEAAYRDISRRFLFAGALVAAAGALFFLASRFIAHRRIILWVALIIFFASLAATFWLGTDLIATLQSLDALQMP